MAETVKLEATAKVALGEKHYLELIDRRAADVLIVNLVREGVAVDSLVLEGAEVAALDTCVRMLSVGPKEKYFQPKSDDEDLPGDPK